MGQSFKYLNIAEQLQQLRSKFNTYLNKALTDLGAGEALRLFMFNDFEIFHFESCELIEVQIYDFMFPKQGKIIIKFK